MPEEKHSVISVNDPTLYHPPQRQTVPLLSHLRSLTPPVSSLRAHLYHSVPPLRFHFFLMSQPAADRLYLPLSRLYIIDMCFSNLSDLKTSKPNLLYSNRFVHLRDVVESHAKTRRENMARQTTL